MILIKNRKEKYKPGAEQTLTPTKIKGIWWLVSWPPGHLNGSKVYTSGVKFTRLTSVIQSTESWVIGN